jgi:nicotinate-nucleotide adenylyltransferase
MRLGVFGGSFDPVHYGHLLLAETCREQAKLDQVWFTPAAVPPHKQSREMTAAKIRVEMLQLAVGGTEYFRVSTLEIDRGGVSYTVDTLTEMKHQLVDAELFLLMGADSLNDFPTWRDPQSVCELAVPLVVRRAGSPPPDLNVLAKIVDAQRLEQIRNHQVEMPVIDLSSTDIRNRIREGRSIRFRTPRAVEKYIQTHNIYQTEAS